MKLKYTGKKQRYQCIGVLASLKGIREMQYQQIYISQNEYCWTLIKSKFKPVGYPLPFIDNVFCTFKERNTVDQNNVTYDNDDEPLLPPYLSEVNKCFILLKLPFCQNNETKSKHFLKKFHHFTKNNFDIAISWETRKIQTLFHLKDKNLYPACKIYYGVCKCGEDYVGETKRNTITRW